MANTKLDNPAVNSLQTKAIIACVIGTIISGVGLVLAGMDLNALLQSHLFAFMFWNGLSLACLGALMLHHLVGGPWGFINQRMFEAGAKLLIFTALLFIPILLLKGNLYPWLDDAYMAKHPIVQAKTAYLNPTGYTVRALVFFGIWIVMALLLAKWSKAQDADGNPKYTLWMRWLSGPGLVIYVLTITFATTDWTMSLEPEWFSTIYGLQLMVGGGLAMWALMTIMLAKLEKTEPHSDIMCHDYYGHMGNWLLAFTVLWAYMSFSQFLITYSGNLPEEIPWYLNRQSGSLAVVAVVLMIFHFALPMFLLFWKRVTRNLNRLVLIASLVFLMRFVDLHWIIKPAFHRGSLGTPGTLFMDVGAQLAMGGLWIFLFVLLLKKQPIMPQNDQRMTYAFAKYTSLHHHHDSHADTGEEAAEHA
jgi:hypothetical protein